MNFNRFITLEGVDGSGKSLHVEAIVTALRRGGHEVVQTREPGGTELGEALRALLLQHNIHLEAEVMLLMAARAQHIAEVIRPALDKGAWVVSDRFADSSFAYQGGGRLYPLERLSQMSAWVQGGIEAGLTFVFDLPCEIARERMYQAKRNLDRFEKEELDFCSRVRLAYLERAKHHSQRFCLIDAKQSPENIHHQLIERLDTYRLGNAE